MKASLLIKLERLAERFEEVNALLADPAVMSDQDQFRRLGKEHAELEPVVAVLARYRQCADDLAEAQTLITSGDPELRALGEDELQAGRERQTQLADELQHLMLPRDLRDGCNIFLEIRAGAGGDEAAIFAGDLFRMYSRYAERQRWQLEVISASDGEHGGYKEIIVRIAGDKVYSRLKFESGGHRVQRVPETESQGRIHTSACTVAILPEPDEVGAIELRKEDLRIDTFRSSGAGGQHVNKTDSAIRILHLPTGLVVECQDERSQHKNRARALSLLEAKLLAQAQQAQQQATATERRDLVGSGDRSDRIRTYNYPQGRVTDHRINVTLYSLNEVLDGELDELIRPLTAEYQADQLAALAEAE